MKLLAADIPFSDSDKLGMERLLYIFSVQVISNFVIYTYIYAIICFLFRKRYQVL